MKSCAETAVWSSSTSQPEKGGWLLVLWMVTAAYRRWNIFILDTWHQLLWCGRLRSSHKWISFRAFLLPWVGKNQQIGKNILQVLTAIHDFQATSRVSYNFGMCWSEKSPSQILWYTTGTWEQSRNSHSIIWVTNGKLLITLAKICLCSLYWGQVEGRLMWCVFSGISSRISW